MDVPSDEIPYKLHARPAHDGKKKQKNNNCQVAA